MRIETGLQDDLARWMSAKLGGLRICRPFVILGFVCEDQAGTLAGAMLVNMYTGADCEVSLALERMVTPRIVRACGQYVFDQLGCRRATFRIRADNRVCIRTARHMGAAHEGTLRAFYPDGTDCHLYGLLKEDFPHGFRSDPS